MIPTTEAQGRFWGQWASAGPRVEGGGDHYVDQVCAIVREVASRCSSHTVAADVGCGNGWITRVLTQTFGDVWGVEIAEASLDLARAQAPVARFELGDFVALPKDKLPAQCDLVVSCEVVAHVSNQPEFFRRVRGMLKPDGRFLLITQNPTTWSRTRHVTPPSPDQIRAWLSLPEIRALCEQAGLRVVRSSTLMPHGDTGALWWRPYANGLLRRIIGRPATHRLFEAMGLGRSIVVEAIPG